MKQVNVLMKEALLGHIEKIAQATSLLFGLKVTVSDIVRWSVEDYSKYGQVDIKVKLSNENRLIADIKSLKEKESVNIDVQIFKDCTDEREQRLKINLVPKD